jgi:hypothetical protein
MAAPGGNDGGGEGNRHRILATAEKLVSELEPVLARVRQQLIHNGINESSRLIVVFLRAFNLFTQSLVALSPDNDHWYCHCYGLELLCK